MIYVNAFHNSNHLRLLICYTVHIDEKKTVEFGYVAICVKIYRLNTLLFNIVKEISQEIILLMQCQAILQCQAISKLIWLSFCA